MKVLFISHYPTLFGANRSLLSLIDGLQRGGKVRPQVIVAGEGDFSAELKRRNIPCWAMPFEYNTHEIGQGDSAGNHKADALKPMLDIVRKTNPDVIYSNSSIIYYGAWIAKITRKPHVWHMREYCDLDYGLAHDLGTPYFRSLVSECAFAIAISRSIERHHLADLDDQRKKVIYNGVARLDQFARTPRQLAVGKPPRLGLIGLVHPGKGQSQAIDALRLLRGTFPNIVLNIAGSGESRYVAPLLAQVREHGLEKNVKFSGFVADPIAWLGKEVDLLLMCSQNEAFGRVSAEAMTQGIPVIGTATGGTPEIITDGFNGVLYNGTAEALAEKIAQIAGDRDAYERLSRTALDDSKKRFTVERYVGEVSEVLEQVGRRARQNLAAVPKPAVAVASATKRSEPNLFLDPPLEPNNCDLFWVRSSIHRALKQVVPLFHGVFLDIGCGVMPYRSEIVTGGAGITRYIGLDIETDIYNANVDLRWDGKRIPLEDGSVDCAMATEVLEHCAEPLVVLKEVRRVLKPGGVFFFTVPYIWPLHDAPHDFYRYTPFALEKLLREAGFENANIQALGGWNASLAQMIGLWLKRAPMAQDMRTRMATQLWPFYQELVRTDELPADPKAGNTMATGWSGVAFASHGNVRKEVEQGEMPLVLVRCHESKYSETFIEDHVNYLSRSLTLVHGHPFPRFLKGGRSILSEEFERKLQMAGANGGRDVDALWKAYVHGVASYLKASRAKMVLIETGLMAAFFHEACEEARVPYVVHFHGVDATGREILDRWGARYRRFFKKAKALVVVSQAMKAQLLRLGAPSDRVVLAPYGVSVDVPRLAEPARVGPRFLAVGRFVEKKGPGLTLEAFAEVLCQVPEARLVMVGDGPLLSDCRRWAATHGIDHAVTFTGVLSRASVSALMANSRVFVQHSLTASDGDSEGLPLAILEAGAHGLAVVSTQHAGIPDAITDGVQGYLVVEKDVKAMAERMLRLAKDPTEAGRLGGAFRARVCAEFSRNVSITRLQAILAKAAGGGDDLDVQNPLEPLLVSSEV